MKLLFILETITLVLAKVGASSLDDRVLQKLPQIRDIVAHSTRAQTSPRNGDRALDDGSCDFDSLFAENCTLAEYCSEQSSFPVTYTCTGSIDGAWTETETLDLEACFYNGTDPDQFDPARFNAETDICFQIVTTLNFNQEILVSGLDKITITRPFQGEMEFDFAYVVCADEDVAEFEYAYGDNLFCDAGPCTEDISVNGVDCVSECVTCPSGEQGYSCTNFDIGDPCNYPDDDDVFFEEVIVPFLQEFVDTTGGNGDTSASVGKSVLTLVSLVLVAVFVNN